MKRLAAFFLMGMFGLGVLVPSAFAEEAAAPAQPKVEPPPAPVETPEAALPAAQLPAAVPPAPMLRPIVITFSGSMSATDSKSAVPVIEVEDRYGVEKKILVPDSAQIAAGGEPRALKELKLGQGLTVEYTYDVATGARTALKITAEETS